MTRHMRIGMAITTALLTVTMVTGAAGQVGGGRPQGAGPGQHAGMMPPPRAEMQYAGGSLFILQGMTLTKYDAGTLQASGTCTLTGDTASPTTTGQLAPLPPMGPSLLLVAGTDANAALLVVAGGTFYRIQTADMSVAVKKALPITLPTLPMPAMDQGIPPAGPPDDPAHMDGDGVPNDEAGAAPGRPDGGPAGRAGDRSMVGTERGPGERPSGRAAGMGPGNGMRPPAPPSHLLHDDTLFLLCGNQLLAINTRTGEVIAQGTSTATTATNRKR